MLNIHVYIITAENVYIVCNNIIILCISCKVDVKYLYSIVLPFFRLLSPLFYYTILWKNELNFYYAVFTPDADEASGARHLHVKSMQRCE